MFIVYKKGDIRNQIVAWGADKERRLEELEAILLMADAIHPPERRQPHDRRENDKDDSEEDEDDRSLRMRSAATSTNGRNKNIRDTHLGNDSDSDFDFDL